MTSIAKSFANIFNQTQDFNMNEFFDNLNSENKDKLFQIVLNSDHIAEILNNNVSEIMCQDKEQVDSKEVEEEVKPKLEKIWCDVCNVNVAKASISRHNKTKKHLKNIENNTNQISLENNLDTQINEEEKTEEVVDYKNVALDIRWGIICSCIPMITKYTGYELIETDCIYTLLFRHKITKKEFAILSSRIKDGKYPTSVLKIINGAISQFIKSKKIKKVMVLADKEFHGEVYDIKKINCETIRTTNDGLFNIYALAPYTENFKNKDEWNITGHKYGGITESIVSFMVEEAFNKSTKIYKKYNAEYLKNVLDNSF